MKEKYQQAPGRGLMNQTAFDLRMNYLETLSKDISKDVKSESIALSQIQNNIESFIGTVEIPLGLIGPLLFNDKNKAPELVHSAVATTEGALVASLNRGAKAISESGGFEAHIVHQKMVRTPMYTFKRLSESIAFDEWIKSNFKKIKEQAQMHSNHAELLEITSVIIGKIVHLKFVYSTSDASGQNMTTSCTWSACLWIEENFELSTSIEILNFVIEGNGASDKKVSFYAMQNGRGCHVISECFLTNEVIEKTLRTNAKDMFSSYNHSLSISRLDGMIGHNVNVANAIAGIYASTGQDLACIHESSIGILQIELTKEGLYLSLVLPNLVIGTVGGGTHLPVPSRILELMDCKGAGKIERFAKLIAGFALSIEISTLAAIVSGQFARAHQKLGRNKPIKWLLRSEVDADFIKTNIPYFSAKIDYVNFNNEIHMENGILTDLTKKITKKVIGFIKADIHSVEGKEYPLLLKSKALGKEVLDGLHFMASNVSVDLADILAKHYHVLEYKDNHTKEIDVYEALQNIRYQFMPVLYGTKNDSDREIYLIIMERLASENMLLINSESTPEKWTLPILKKTINSIHIVHANYQYETDKIDSIEAFVIEKALELYADFVALNRKDYDYLDADHRFDQLTDFINDWRKNGYKPKSKLTLIHNDFNPRNIAIRTNGNPCIYDWELATYGIPHRDIFELLAFTLAPNFEKSDLTDVLKHHYKLVKSLNNYDYSWSDYLCDFKLGGQAFLVSRVNFYLTGSILMNYPFIERVFATSFNMLDTVKKMS
ncbi:phosphotransferase [Aestuariivivens sp. NBU2969]|uniref:phosphotransferase n=1 Tax=Aestuariivivens sp. NBU2969 TaxID=2873267 RepID=UPI001CC08323|nr:phosphotransferase [Aestuariivivens sp. NBU2969]